MRHVERSRLVCTIGIAIALALSAGSSFGQPWPERPVRFVVPIAPGSSPDVAARLFAQHLSARWGQPVIVENHPGADGIIGTAAFAAAHDDHTLLFSPAAPLTVYPFTQGKLSYDPVRDVVPISKAANTFGTISVTASLPVITLAEFVAFARTRPGQLNWTSGGGAFPILFAAFAKTAGLDMVEVPYRDQNLAVQDIAGGRIQAIATPMTPILPLVHAGKIRVLAITNRMRSPFSPDIPTATESGYPALAFEGLFGIFGPRGISDGRRERIAADVREIAADHFLRGRLAATGQVVGGSTPAEFSADIEEQRIQIEALVRLVGKPAR